ncbi:MAG: HEAT repeat domain-containing protein [Acidobacteriota bacterium]
MQASSMKEPWRLIVPLLAGGLLPITCSPAASFVQEAQVPAFLTGRIQTIGSAGDGLSERLEQAARDAKGSDYFTVYLFESRHKIRCHSEGRTGEQYLVQARGSTIHIRAGVSEGHDGYTTNEDDDTPAPAGLLLLHDRSGAVTDASVLDPDQRYKFAETPVYWLGIAGNEESVDVVEAAFAGSPSADLKNTLLFIASSHRGARGRAFLKEVALGQDVSSVREKAVFWLGCFADPGSLGDLMEIYGRENSEHVRKQIVFAVSLNKSSEATSQLVVFARNDADREIRKTAVFWLGQRASAECVKALRDIVEDDSSGLKEQAVFAISQLPKSQSVPMLIEIAKTNASASVRKKAIFWLGQTGDELALKFFEDILVPQE